ncbi:MAG TPA: hypothetical protein VI455_16405 [Terriglobia bacterium]
MRIKLLMLVAAMLVFASLSWSKTITGVVSDAMCGAKHDKASDDAAACVKKCEDGGSKLVVVSGGKVYTSDDQDKLQGHEGHEVKVTGTVTGDSIKIDSVAMAGS